MASPELASIVKMFRSVRPPEGAGIDVARGRAMMQTMVAPPPRGVRATATEASGMRAEWLVPEGADPDVRLLYLHGGAYVAGSVETHRGLAGRIARAAGCVALTVDYRLAPEHPFPAALDDALAGYAYVAANAPDGARPARRLFVAGDSAGGGLALATLVAARDGALPRAHAGALLSAWTDLAATGESMKTREAADPLLVPALVPVNAALYLGGHDARDPRASPLYAELAGLPPLLVQVGDAEILLDDSTRVAERARAAGVDVTLEVWPEMIHVWHSLSGILPEGKQAIERVGAFVRAQSV